MPATNEPVGVMKTRLPLHPLFVHFPVALWTSALLLDLASLRFGSDAVWAAAAVGTFGTIMAVPTAILGLYDLTRLHAGTEAKRTAIMHAGFMVPATVLFVVVAWLRVRDLGSTHTPAIVAALNAVGLLLVVVGGFVGHRLVFELGANVLAPRHDPTGTEVPIRPQVPLRE